jgi:hypothetical protein
MHMLAGPAYNEKLSYPSGRMQQLLRAGKNDGEIVEEFYLAAFGRAPEPQELSAIRNPIAGVGDHEAALKDFVWALSCSREFAENH